MHKFVRNESKYNQTKAEKRDSLFYVMTRCSPSEIPHITALDSGILLEGHINGVMTLRVLKCITCSILDRRLIFLCLSS